MSDAGSLAAKKIDDLVLAWATQLLDRKKHRQEEENLKTDVKQKELNRRTSERRDQAGLDYPEREGGKPKVNEAGDTVKQSIVTDRYRGRNAEGMNVHDERLTVQRDTIYVEKRDSVFVQNTDLTNPTNKKNTFVSSLKWIFWILMALSA